ncbi:MAG: ATP-binding cassette domain-containing protein [Planctomycetota bacterium]|nr:MAG: ATP-binding cassette domain-containing protein [Planctomycetota bacterium]
MTELAQSVDVYNYLLEGPRNSALWDRYYLLYLEDISAVFDGFTALNIADLGICHNELRVVVGPNGAGKSTMCDVVSGLTRPTTGQVYFNGQVITQLDVADIASRGVRRKFQTPNVFDSLSVWENMLLALPALREDDTAIARRIEAYEPRLSGPAGVAAYRLWHRMRNLGGRVTPERQDRITQLLERVGLLAERRTLARQLSHGQRQWLAIAGLILSAPKLLLVDEPAAGLTDHETALTAQLLNELKGEHTLIVIEHDMEFVRLLDSRVTVLNEGKVLADGSLSTIQSDARVIEAYLGR